jgi:hypothetical protein
VGGSATDLMNNHPEMASAWKGRVLMSVVAEKTEKPEIKKMEVDAIAKSSSLELMDDKEY